MNKKELIFHVVIALVCMFLYRSGYSRWLTYPGSFMLGRYLGKGIIRSVEKHEWF